MPAMRLAEEGFLVTGWFMNPNIQPLAEYLRRREGATQCAARLGIPIIYDDTAWDLSAWLEKQLPRATDPQRCHWCCQSRLEAAAMAARELGFEFFSSSLLYSRYQPHEAIKERGFALSASGPEFVYRDFRENWQQGIDLSLDWGIYRQPYCGCVFSEAERYAKKFARVRKTS